jgi:hypothetical protein
MRPITGESGTGLFYFNFPMAFGVVNRTKPHKLKGFRVVLMVTLRVGCATPYTRESWYLPVSDGLFSLDPRMMLI